MTSVASIPVPVAAVRVPAAKVTAIGFLVAAAVSLAVAVRLPLDVVVFGLLVLGVAHLGYEVRYITGRYRSLLHGRLLVGVSAALVLIIVGRLLVGGTAWTIAEILILTGMLAAVVVVSDRRPRRRAAGLFGIAGVAAVALAHPPWWFVSQAWLHNLVPAVFLWQWSASLGARSRHGFRAVTALWLVVVPALLLAGALDGWLQGGSPLAATVAADAGVQATVVPAGLEAGGITVTRLIAAFAFLQLLHYTVWLWHFPRVDRGATAVFESTPVGDVLRGWRLPALVLGVSVVLAGAAWLDYRAGRGLYTSLAAYHAYLEYPVVLALALGTARVATTDPAEPPAPTAPSMKEPA